MAKIEEWRRWIERIELDVRNLLVSREIYRGLDKIVRDNPSTHYPNDFVEWCFLNYSDLSQIAIRRQCTVRNDSVSLARLLREIAQAPEVITRAWHQAELLPEKSSQQALRKAVSSFDEWAPSGEDHVSPAVVKSDKEKLDKAWEPLKHFVNKRIAHMDEKPSNEIPTPKWGELDHAITLLDKCTVKYLRLLKQEYCNSLCPVFQYNWQQVFHHAWKPSNHQT